MRKRIVFSFLFLACFSMFCAIAQKPLFRAGSLLKESKEALSSGNFNRALILADSVIENTTNLLSLIESLSLRARINSMLGNLSLADKDYLKTLELASEYSDESPSTMLENALFNYAQFLMLTGRYEESLNMLDFNLNSSRLKPSPDIIMIMASALSYLDKDKEALQLLDDLINQESYEIPSGDKAVILQNRGFIKNKTGDFKGASEDFAIAIQGLTGKQKGVAMANFALTLAKEGNIKKAEDLIDNSISLLKEFGNEDEDLIIAIRKKGEILNIAGNQKKANENFESFFNLERKRLIYILPTMPSHLRLNYWIKEKPLLSKVFLIADYNPSLAFDAALLRRQSSLLANKNDSLILNRLHENSIDIANKLKKDEAAIAFILYPDRDDELQYAALSIDSRGNTNFTPLFPHDSIYSPSPNSGLSLYESVISDDPIHKNFLYSDSEFAEKFWGPILKELPDNINTIHFAPEGIFHLLAIENIPIPDKEELKILRHFSLNDITDSETNIVSYNSEHTLICGGFDFDNLDNSNEISLFEKESNHDAYEHICRSLRISEGKQIFTYLPGSLKESLRITRNLSDISPKHNLSEESFKENASKYHIIHLATHGYTINSDIAPTKRMETDSLGFDITLWASGIAMSGANVAAMLKGREDGIISAREFCDLDLSGTSLIILSACQTARGVISDESASGLIRALKNAGASTIVASLWEVDDESTSFFMTDFHKNLAEGLPKYQAFEKARDNTRNFSMLKAERKFSPATLASKPTGSSSITFPYSDPWYWAPFIIIDP